MSDNIKQEIAFIVREAIDNHGIGLENNINKIFNLISNTSPFYIKLNSDIVAPFTARYLNGYMDAFNIIGIYNLQDILILILSAAQTSLGSVKSISIAKNKLSLDFDVRHKLELEKLGFIVQQNPAVLDYITISWK